MGRLMGLTYTWVLLLGGRAWGGAGRSSPRIHIPSNVHGRSGPAAVEDRAQGPRKMAPDFISNLNPDEHASMNIDKVGGQVDATLASLSKQVQDMYNNMVVGRKHNSEGLPLNSAPRGSPLPS